MVFRIIQNNTAVKEALDRLSKKELCGIWSIFGKWVNESISAISEEPELTANDEFPLITLFTMSSMASLTIDCSGSNEPQALGAAIKSMNKVLKSISCKKTGLSICQTSEKYWKIHPDTEVPLCVGVVWWYLTQALLPKATVSTL